MMKSYANLPVFFLKVARKFLVAYMLAIPLMGTASAEMGAFTLTSSVKKLVNVTGKVIDESGDPVIGATVLIKGTKTGVQTDENGIFRINLPAGNETIVVSYLGYKVQEVNVAGRTEITIALEPSDAIDEVVVTGYGTQRRSEIVGSIATITGAELMDIPAPNIAGALRNRIAGVGVSEASGRPGAGITLNVRGASTSDRGASIGATSEPLYIIDGITVESETFDNLDASMVENITILKDASAAIYGAAGAKGVVLITTKKGKQGKPSITYNGYLGVTDAATKPDLLSAYELGVFLNEGYKANNATEDKYFSPEDLEYLKGLNVKNWHDQLWQSSTMQKHNLSISGGSEKVTFFVGGSYQNEKGNYAGMKQDKYSFRSGVTATVLDGLKADISFNVDHRIRLSNNSLGNDTDNTFYEALVSTPDWIPLAIDGMPVYFVRGNTRNPIAILESGYYDHRKTQGYRVNAGLTYQPKFLEGLSARFQISQGGNNANNTQYTAPYKLFNFERMGNNNQFYSTQLAAINPIVDGVSDANASLVPLLNRDNSYQGFFTLSYANTFNAHSIDVVIGGEQTVRNGEDLSVRWDNQLIPDADDYWGFDQNRLQLSGRSITESTKRSFFGRLGYDFDKKYLIQLVSRLDASSNFARGNRWGLSPSLGIGWIVSQEDFFKDNVSFVDYLKLKVNYGITGDDRVRERLWQERYERDINNGYMFGDNNYGIGLNHVTYPNLNITWEKRRTFNAGIEASMLNSRLNLGMEFFQNKTYDGFDQGAAELNPLYSGLIAPIVNYREAYNWGSEFTIGYRTKIGSEMGINASMHFGYGNSIVTKIIYPPGDLRVTDRSDGKWLGNKFGTDPRQYNSSNIGYQTLGMFRTQEQVDAFLTDNPNYTIDGQVPQAGWLMYEDTNGDGMVNRLDMVPLFNKTNPVFSSGINIGLSYKDFGLSTNIMARIGGKLFFDSQARTKADVDRNVLGFWRDRWTPDNPMEGKYPRADDPLINSNSDFWAVNGTTIRINNMTISYRMPSTIANRVGMNNVRFLLTGNNLWTLVNPYGYKDPYTSNSYNYPTVRTISLGLSLNL